MLFGVIHYIVNHLGNIDNNVMDAFKSLNNRVIDFEIYQAWQEDDYLEVLLRNEIIRFSKDFGYYSVKFKHQLNELFSKINGSSMYETNHTIHHKYSIEYIVSKVEESDSHKVIAIVARSKKCQMNDYVGLFINVIVGFDHDNKIATKFIDSGRTELETGYTIFR